MEYWINVEDEEWGMVGSVRPETVTLAAVESESIDFGGWVDRFIETMEGKGSIRFVEDKAEFDYLFRCLESIGKRLSFCPINPAAVFEKTNLFSRAA